jgi:hypothetical protein
MRTIVFTATLLFACTPARDPVSSTAAVAPRPPPPREAAPLDTSVDGVERLLRSHTPVAVIDLTETIPAAELTRLRMRAALLHKQTGGSVWIVWLPKDADVNDYGIIYWHLWKSPRDFLFLFNGKKRHMHSQAIPKPKGAEILALTNDEFYRDPIAGTHSMMQLAGEFLGVSDGS